MGCRAVTQATIRDDYQKLDSWTYAEAGKYAEGRGFETIKKWARTPVRRADGGMQYRFLVHKLGAAKVDAKSFKAYWPKGDPQGEKPPKGEPQGEKA